MSELILAPLILNIDNMQKAILGFRDTFTRRRLSNRHLTQDQWVASLPPRPQKPLPVQWKPVHEGANQ